MKKRQIATYLKWGAASLIAHAVLLSCFMLIANLSKHFRLPHKTKVQLVKIEMTPVEPKQQPITQVISEKKNNTA